MKVVRKITWELPPLEHFQKDLEWDVKSMEDVKKELEDYATNELYDTYGYYPKEETFIEE
jgi:hypothetical protein